MLSHRHFSLLALSPSGGRYAEQTMLTNYFSECALIKYRLELEIKWFMTITDNSSVTKLLPLSEKAKSLLRNLNANFSFADAVRLQDIEQTTRDDVKAIAYFIKEKVMDNKEIVDRLAFIHFGINSEDINNLAYGLMLFHTLAKCIYPQLSLLSKKLAPGNSLAPLIIKLEYCLLEGKLSGEKNDYSVLKLAHPEENWQAVCEKFIRNIGLDVSTQTEIHEEFTEAYDTLRQILAELHAAMPQSVRLVSLKNPKEIFGELLDQTHLSLLCLIKRLSNMGTNHVKFEQLKSFWNEKVADHNVTELSKEKRMLVGL